MVKIFFSPNTWQMMTFLNPLTALIPKIQFSFFADFGLWVTSEARGSVSVGFWGSRQLSAFGGGGLASGLYRPPPPPQLKACLPKQTEVAVGPRVGCSRCTLASEGFPFFCCPICLPKALWWRYGAVVGYVGR